MFSNFGKKEGSRRILFFKAQIPDLNKVCHICQRMKMTTNQDFQSLTLWQEVPEYHTENIGSIERPSINLHNLQNI